jgi:hypothetical protein
MHYEIRLDNPAKLTQTQRLQQACDFARGISTRLDKANKADLVLTLYLAELKFTTCGKAD